MYNPISKYSEAMFGNENDWQAYESLPVTRLLASMIHIGELVRYSLAYDPQKSFGHWDLAEKVAELKGWRLMLDHLLEAGLRMVDATSMWTGPSSPGQDSEAYLQACIERIKAVYEALNGNLGMTIRHMEAWKGEISDLRERLIATGRDPREIDETIAMKLFGPVDEISPPPVIDVGNLANDGVEDDPKAAVNKLHDAGVMPKKKEEHLIEPWMQELMDAGEKGLDDDVN